MRANPTTGSYDPLTGRNPIRFADFSSSEERVFVRDLIKGLQIYVHAGTIISDEHQTQRVPAGVVARYYGLNVRQPGVQINHDYMEEHYTGLNGIERARNYPEQVHLTLLATGASYGDYIREKVSEARRMIEYNRLYHSSENKSVPEMHHQMTKGLRVYVFGGLVASADGDHHTINAKTCLLHYGLSLRSPNVKIGSALSAASFEDLPDDPRDITLFPCSDGRYVENFCKKVEMARNRLEEVEKGSVKFKTWPKEPQIGTKPVQLQLFDTETEQIPCKSEVEPPNCKGKRKFFGFDLSVHDSFTGAALVTRGIDGVIKGLKFIT